jgi:hypothetical protein
MNHATEQRDLSSIANASDHLSEDHLSERQKRRAKGALRNAGRGFFTD